MTGETEYGTQKGEGQQARARVDESVNDKRRWHSFRAKKNIFFILAKGFGMIDKVWPVSI